MRSVPWSVFSAASSLRRFGQCVNIPRKRKLELCGVLSHVFCRVGLTMPNQPRADERHTAPRSHREFSRCIPLWPAVCEYAFTLDLFSQPGYRRKPGSSASQPALEVFLYFAHGEEGGCLKLIGKLLLRWSVTSRIPAHSPTTEPVESAPGWRQVPVGRRPLILRVAKPLLDEMRMPPEIGRNLRLRHLSRAAPITCFVDRRNHRTVARPSVDLRYLTNPRDYLVAHDYLTTRRSDARPANISLAIIGTEDHVTGDNEQFQQISIQQMLRDDWAQTLGCREDDHLAVHA